MSRSFAGEKVQPIVHKAGLTALLTAATAIISLASLLVLVQTSRVATTGYDIQRLETIKEEWKQKNYQLEAEIATLQSLENIERQAKTKLKMVPATNHVYVEVKQPSPATVGTTVKSVPSMISARESKT